MAERVRSIPACLPRSHTIIPASCAECFSGNSLRRPQEYIRVFSGTHGLLWHFADPSRCLINISSSQRVSVASIRDDFMLDLKM